MQLQKQVISERERQRPSGVRPRGPGLGGRRSPSGARSAGVQLQQLRLQQLKMKQLKLQQMKLQQLKLHQIKL